MLFFAAFFTCPALYCVGFHCLTLHVSAYMAIFNCGIFFIYIYFHMFKDSASMLLFAAFFTCPSASLFVGFHCRTLHISGYMAIVKCEGFFIYLVSYV
jgi:hypothetical protein